jgi:MoaD family protein
LEVRVRFYGLVHDEVGSREIRYELPDDSTLMDLMKLIVSAYPVLEEMVYDEKGGFRDYLEVAVNQVSVLDLDAGLTDGDLIQIMPPIGGG